MNILSDLFGKKKMLHCLKRIKLVSTKSRLRCKIDRNSLRGAKQAALLDRQKHKARLLRSKFPAFPAAAAHGNTSDGHSTVHAQHDAKCCSSTDLDAIAGEKVRIRCGRFLPMDL